MCIHCDFSAFQSISFDSFGYLEYFTQEKIVINHVFRCNRIFLKSFYIYFPILLGYLLYIQYPQRKPLHFYPIQSCVYPIRFSVYLIVKTVNQVLRLSCIRFCVYQVFRLSCIRFCVYHVNRYTSAFSWTNERKTQRSPTFCYYCRIIKYCRFLSAVTICFCFLKLKVYQYCYEFN